ncbi:hypothetical protein M409DRAFT_53948 [Zasmidium cellare ATCC 36951]|uniref:Uncharacterized protein n=1 Tax=Zasmidium cellare ATCC 36951 TaxID=1080233 RepID=A0A6A6CJY4_ZASCE|nr:uncharacterized protein M409DRAFT_53948 [Zasmidium cellare ATCC 36951]KAF2167341.1 hypothetical protein M409DRAFT_53948 [Zasmidium cellare ATCC 36951]
MDIVTADVASDAKQGRHASGSSENSYPETPCVVEPVASVPVCLESNGSHQDDMSGTRRISNPTVIPSTSSSSAHDLGHCTTLDIARPFGWAVSYTGKGTSTQTSGRTRKRLPGIMAVVGRASASRDNLGECPPGVSKECEFTSCSYSNEYGATQQRYVTSQWMLLLVSRHFVTCGGGYDQKFLGKAGQLQAYGTEHDQTMPNPVLPSHLKGAVCRQPFHLGQGMPTPDRLGLQVRRLRHCLRHQLLTQLTQDQKQAIGQPDETDSLRAARHDAQAQLRLIL